MSLKASLTMPLLCALVESFYFMCIESVFIEMDCCLPYGHQHRDFGFSFGNTSMNLLSLDLRVSIVKYLPTNDVYHFMRSCQFNLYASKQHIQELLLYKFKFLLTTSNNTINIEHLLEIPFIDLTQTSVFRVSNYFINQSNSSIFIGIDSNTNTSFISFMLQKAARERTWMFIFMFNDTDIVSIFVSKHPFANSVKLQELDSERYALNDMKAIAALILDGKKESILGDFGAWFLKSTWDQIVREKRHLIEQEKLWKENCCIIQCVLIAIAWVVLLLIIFGMIFGGFY